LAWVGAAARSAAVRTASLWLFLRIMVDEYCAIDISRGVLRCLYETVLTLGMYDVAEEVEWQEKRIILSLPTWFLAHCVNWPFQLRDVITFSPLKRCSS
jgi:hypothetical protein